MKREYPESQPKYSPGTTIPDAESGRMRSPYPIGDDWYYKNESTELRLVPFETYRSGEIVYVDNTIVSFAHGWIDFDPAIHWYSAQAWGLCIQSQAGWSVGDRVLFNERRGSIYCTSTDVNVVVAPNGIRTGQKSGNGNEINVNANRWLLYVMAIREVF